MDFDQDLCLDIDQSVRLQDRKIMFQVVNYGTAVYAENLVWAAYMNHIKSMTTQAVTQE